MVQIPVVLVFLSWSEASCLKQSNQPFNHQFFPAPTVNPCQSSPCLNGGSCQVNGNNFFCQCPVGFSGTRCETGMLWLDGTFNWVFLGKCPNVTLFKEMAA